jgi:hypothetical protein
MMITIELSVEKEEILREEAKRRAQRRAAVSVIRR